MTEDAQHASTPQGAMFCVLQAVDFPSTSSGVICECINRTYSVYACVCVCVCVCERETLVLYLYSKP